MKKLIFKIMLDVAMTVVYILLMFPQGTGVVFHIVAGLSVGALFILHFILNRGVFSAMLRSIRQKKLKPRTATLLAFDVMLIVGMPMLIVTGVLISGIFTVGLGSAAFTVYQIHDISAWVCLAAMLSHIAVHARYLVSSLRSIFNRRRDREVRRAFARFASGVMAACMLYVIGFQLYKSGIAVPSTGSFSSPSEISYDQESSYAGDKQSSYDDGNTVIVSDSGSESSDSSSSTIVPDSEIGESGSSDSSAVSATPSSDDGTTLEEYLSTLFCTGCGRHCPLSNPQCGRSAQQIAEATADYNAKFSA